MRLSVAGLIIASLLVSAASAADDFVQSIGINGRYRPDRWTPLVVHLTPQAAEPRPYQIQVWQDDLDSDKVLYTKDITLSPGGPQTFEVYFVPRPTGEGIGFNSVGELQQALKVRLCEKPAEGKRAQDARVVIDRISIAFTVSPFDPQENQPRTRLILFVTEGGISSQPVFNEYRIGPDPAPGLSEPVEAIGVRPEELGQNVLYYDSVDAVVWLSGDADKLNRNGENRLDPLTQYVRRGGKLIVCQPPDDRKGKLAALADLLPIQARDASGQWAITYSAIKTFVDQHGPDAEKDARDALPMLAGAGAGQSYSPQWHLLSKKDKEGHDIGFAIARATAKPDAIVDVWQNWAGEAPSPYLVRGALGLGEVTWVAQDLGDPNLTAALSPDRAPLTANWAHVWDRVIGWANATRTAYDLSPINAVAKLQIGRWNTLPGDSVNMGRWMLKGTDYAAKGAAYTSLAVLFFVLYWIAAGPGSYFYLARKKRKELNWIVFGGWAFAALFLTVIIVKLVLRGDPEARHLSVVRQTPGEPTYVISRLGLYIPRDGDQTVSLADIARDTQGYITPLQLHPALAAQTEFPAAQEYAIADPQTGQPVSVDIPFRSTMKKLQARWAGETKGTISGPVRLVSFKNGVIAGNLVNQTGVDLRNIYLAFDYLQPGGVHRDKVLFIPRWPSGSTLDLNHEWSSSKIITDPDHSLGPKSADPNDRDLTSIHGDIAGQWEEYWTRGWSEDRTIADFDAWAPRVFPMLSLFDRIHPTPAVSENVHHFDLVRRDDDLNMSAALSAGKLVVLAQSMDDLQPLPMPLQVNGYNVSGKGRVLYQFAIPVDRLDMEKDAASK